MEFLAATGGTVLLGLGIFLIAWIVQSFVDSGLRMRQLLVQSIIALLLAMILGYVIWYTQTLPAPVTLTTTSVSVTPSTVEVSPATSEPGVYSCQTTRDSSGNRFYYSCESR